MWRPEIDQHRLTRRQPGKFIDRNIAIRRADILTKGEERIVSEKRVDGGLVPKRYADLGGKRVGLNVNPALTAEVFLANLLRTGDIEKGIGLAIEGVYLCFGQPVTFAVGIFAAESPAVFEAIFLEHWNDAGQISGGIGGEIVDSWIVDPAR